MVLVIILIQNINSTKEDNREYRERYDRITGEEIPLPDDYIGQIHSTKY